MKSLGFYTSAADSTGTAIRGISNFTPKNFVFIYDNTTGTGRPLYGTQVEITGVSFIAGTYAEFYANDVAGTDGAWGGIVPNINTEGVKRVEERSLTTGAIVSNYTDDDGVWGTVDTKNPAGGIDNVLVINTTLGIGTTENQMGKIFTYGKKLSIQLDQVVNGSIQIFNLYGQEIARYTISVSQALYTLNVPAGAYIVRILSDKGIASEKVMVR